MIVDTKGVTYETVTTRVNSTSKETTQRSRASCGLGNRRSSSANVTSLREVLLRSSLRSLRLGIAERTA